MEQCGTHGERESKKSHNVIANETAKIIVLATTADRLYWFKLLA